MEDLDIPRTVEIHVTFLKLGEVDTLKECFGANVLVRSKWQLFESDTLENTQFSISDVDLSKCWNPDIDIDNAIGTPKVTSSLNIELDRNGNAYVTERKQFKGTFLENMELWDFPFDIQDLSITVVSHRSNTEVELRDDREDMHKLHKQSFIDEQEWYLYKYTESLDAHTITDMADPSTVKPALTVRCRAARRPRFFIWNGFSIFFMIACLSFLTFTISTALPFFRLRSSFLLLLTTITYNFTIRKSLPKTTYLSYLDRYILGNVLLLGLISAWHGIVTTLPEDKADAVEWTDKVILCLFALGYFAYNVIFVAILMSKPYKERRDMRYKEESYVERLRRETLGGAVFYGAASSSYDSSDPTPILLSLTYKRWT